MNLSENYRLVFDENNVTLQFFEQRESKKNDGSVVMIEHTDNLYYPSMKSALKSFLNKYLKGSKDVQECLKRIEEVEAKIDNLKR